MLKTHEIINNIKSEFPKIKWRGYEVIEQGFDNAVIIVNNKIIFRIAKENSIQSRKKNLIEKQLLEFIDKKIKTAVPVYNLVARDASFVGYDKLSGDQLSIAVFGKLSIKEREKLIIQLADFLTEIHGLPLSPLKKFGVEIKNSKKQITLLKGQLKKVVYPKLFLSDIKKIDNLFKKLYKLVATDDANCFVHGDFSADNILWDRKKKQLAVIDFSDCYIGDPALDFAPLWELGDKLISEIYKLYHNKKDVNLLKRSELYYKIIPLLLMKDAKTENNFKNGYSLFKKRFK